MYPVMVSATQVPSSHARIRPDPRAYLGADVRKCQNKNTKNTSKVSFLLLFLFSLFSFFLRQNGPATAAPLQEGRTDIRYQNFQFKNCQYIWQNVWFSCLKGKLMLWPKSAFFQLTNFNRTFGRKKAFSRIQQNVFWLFSQYSSIQHPVDPLTPPLRG